MTENWDCVPRPGVETCTFPNKETFVSNEFYAVELIENEILPYDRFLFILTFQFGFIWFSTFCGYVLIDIMLRPSKIVKSIILLAYFGLVTILLIYEAWDIRWYDI